MYRKNLDETKTVEEKCNKNRSVYQVSDLFQSNPLSKSDSRSNVGQKQVLLNCLYLPQFLTDLGQILDYKSYDQA